MPSTEVLITVCAACLTAACWQGEFLCQEAQRADVVERSIAELTALGREHASWWDIDPDTGCAYKPRHNILYSCAH